MQSSLFDDGGTLPPAATEADALPHPARGSARHSDPVSSHITVQSIIRDDSIAALILNSAVDIHQWACRHELAGLTTDDEIWAQLEAITSRRWQRNVIARARGRLEKEGYFERVPDIQGPHGRPVIAYIPTQLAIEWVANHRGAS